jgi:uncharacterized membrane protein YfhO
VEKLTVNNNKSRNFYIYLLLMAFIAIIIFIVVKGGYLYGSTTDWVSQHSVIPDYFRQKFYETGNLFPDFALNLGSGQNIYNLSYYGLLSPIILISYLLPFVSMATYISVSSIIIVLISGCLCYRWISSNGFSEKLSFVATICFICAGPLIFHSHRQVMFVDYFPFLFMGLIGIDHYIKNRKSWLFILGVFLCIMTSYFFALGCIITLLMYAVYAQMKADPMSSLALTVKGLIPFIKGIVIAVFMSGVLWLPTLYVVLHERGGGESISLLSLFIPSSPFPALLYDSYALGLTAVSFVALVTTLVTGKRNERIVAFVLVLLLIFPVFLYVLNGTIYLRPKALIPFLPLYILIIAVFLTKVENVIHFSKKIKSQSKKPMIVLILLFIMCTATINCLRVNSEDNLVTTKDYSDYINPDKIAMIKETLQRDHSFYRMNDLSYNSLTLNQVYDMGYNQTSIYSSTYNRGYNDFFYNIMHNPIPSRNRVMTVSSKDILFQSFMDVKYIITTGNAVRGYKKIAQRGDYYLYENKHTLSLGFATSSTISQADFDKIQFPLNMSTVFERIVTSKGKTSGSAVQKPSAFQFQQIDIKNMEFNIQHQKNMTIKKDGTALQIDAKEGASIEIPLNINLKDRILIIRFMVSNKENQPNLDTSITINGVKNKLSNQQAPYPNGNSNFVYVLSSNRNSTRLYIKLSAGTYEVSNFVAYTLPATVIPNAIKKMDQMVVDMKNTKDNQIVGDILVSKTGYFATTIPFDKGFEITVDGIKQNYENVNTAFVGFPIDKGRHHIVIRYQSPYKHAGMALSLIGFGAFVYICFPGRKSRLVKNTLAEAGREKEHE